MKVNVIGRGAVSGVGILPVRGIELTEMQIRRILNFKNVRVFNADTGALITVASLNAKKNQPVKKPVKPAAPQPKPVPVVKPEPYVEPVVEVVPEPVAEPVIEETTAPVEEVVTTETPEEIETVEEPVVFTE